MKALSSSKKNFMKPNSEKRAKPARAKEFSVPSATSWEASLAKVKRMRKTNLGQFSEAQELDEFGEVCELHEPDAWGEAATLLELAQLTGRLSFPAFYYHNRM
jgi:hypothetical protein